MGELFGRWMTRSTVAARSAVIVAVVVAMLATATVLVAASNAGAVAGATIVSDDFADQTLSEIWTFHNPARDAGESVEDSPSLELSGSHAIVSVPGGSGHNLWTDNNRAPRLRQTGPFLGDFGVEAKFDSVLSQTFQMQGIVVEQDADTFLRFEIHHDGSHGEGNTTRYFAASLDGDVVRSKVSGQVDNSTTHSLRVLRSGSTWHMRHSTDGTSWSTVATIESDITANYMGPYAGNIVVGGNNAPPAFLGSIDHFFNLAAPLSPDPADTSPPVLSNVAVRLGPGSVQSVTVTWQTDEPATTRISSGFRTTYKDGTDRVIRATRDHSIVLEPVNCGTTYHYKVGSIDSLGHLSESPDKTFRTPACPAVGFNDNFDSASLDSRWHLRDSLGDATLETGGGLLRLSLPESSASQRNGSSIRALQPLPDRQYVEVMVQFESAVSVANQIQGIIFEKDESDLIRFDVYLDAATGQTRVYVGDRVRKGSKVKATTLANVQLEPRAAFPLKMRAVRRQGTWTFETQSAGEFAWKRIWQGEIAMNIARVGPHATHAKVPGAGRAPFISIIDFFKISGGSTPITTPPTSGGPAFTIFGGDGVWQGSGTPVLRFETPGLAQPDVNIRGRVTDPDKILSLTYTVNRQYSRSLSLGSTACGVGISCTTRLALDGDFNADIDASRLKRGWNSVVLRAIDLKGNVSTQALHVVYRPGRGWPLPYEVDWSASGDISADAQIIDGLWAIDHVELPDGGIEERLRTSEIGYDRIVAIGDDSWRAYEVEVPIQIHSVDDENGAAPPSGGAGLGFAVHWQGHVPRLYEQPRAGVVDQLAGLAWYRWPKDDDGHTKLQTRDSKNKPIDERNFDLELGTTYIYKLRVHPAALGSDVQVFHMKVWPQDEPEPDAWTLSSGSTVGPESGSLLLVAHHVDASFGNVQVRPVDHSEWARGGVELAP